MIGEYILYHFTETEINSKCDENKVVSLLNADIMVKSEWLKSIIIC